MIQSILATACALVLGLLAQKVDQSQTGPTTSQPTTKRGSAGKTKREAEQLEIIEKLLQRDSRERVILPRVPDAKGQRAVAAAKGGAESGAALLLEGTILFDRQGRLVLNGDHAEFEFQDEGPGGGVLRTMEINKNANLETMERLAQAGATVFRISAEVTQYRDKNYLNILRVQRSVAHGNLGP